jgi:predicted membrane protein
MQHLEGPSWTGLGRADRIAFGVGAALLVSGIAHLLILFVSGTSWYGPVSWRKPATFGLSFGLTLITVTWITPYLDLQRRSRALSIAALTMASAWETTLVKVQNL